MVASEVENLQHCKDFNFLTNAQVENIQAVTFIDIAAGMPRLGSMVGELAVAWMQGHHSLDMQQSHRAILKLDQVDDVLYFQATICAANHRTLGLHGSYHLRL